MDHARIERLLRLMLMLSSNVDYTTPELADLLEITERSIYRYIRSFKDNGFVLEKRNPNIHKLLKMPLDEIKLDELIQISSEEAFILHTLLLSITGGSQIHINLEQKLAALFDATSITEIIGKKTAAENVRILKKAIDEKECVELIDYESGHTMKVSDRIVEPYGFSTNYADVYAYEQASGICKTFKITRIGWVRPIGTECSEEDIVAIPHLGVSDILNQNTSLSAPSVDFYLKILNGTVNPISGRVGYALFENGNISEKTE